MISRLSSRTRGIRSSLGIASAMLGLWVLPLTHANAAGPQQITKFIQLYQLTRDEAADGRPVHFRAVVLCYDRVWGQLYLTDGSETKWMSPSLFQQEFKPGDLVDLAGTTDFNDASSGLAHMKATVIGHQDLPPAKKIELCDLGHEFGQWVETTGEVRVADTSWERLALVLRDKGQSCLVYVMGSPPETGVRKFVGQTIRIRGINASKIENNQLVKAAVTVPGPEQIQVVKRSELTPAGLPVSAIDTLLNRELGTWTNEMVHLNGIVSFYKPNLMVEMRDPTGVIKAEVIQKTRLQPDQRVDLWGFPVAESTGLVLKDSYFEVMAPNSEVQSAPLINSATTASNSLATLTNASQVAHLSKTQASAQIPVRLRGVITYADPEWHNSFFCDTSGEIYVETTQNDVRSGQWVEVVGQTHPGGFAPEVVASGIKILGVTNLPAPAKVDLGDLANGYLDAHWVQLSGVVRSVAEEFDHLNLSITTPKGHFKAIVPNRKEQQVPPNLVDSVVNIRGACAAQLNPRGQLSGIALHVPSVAAQIDIVEPALADPFSIPASAISFVSAFDPDRRAGGRVKISGTVVLVLPGAAFYVQDSTAGMRVETQETSELHVGDAVEVIGFLAMKDFSPHLESALFRRMGIAKLPQPKRTTAEQILLRGVNDAELVEMDAQLIQNIARSARPRLVLQSGSVVFPANLHTSGSDNYFPPWKPGSVLRIRGVCSIQANDTHEPGGFKLLISSPRDVVLLARAPWWTLKHTLTLAGVFAVGIGIATGWIVLLRGQVKAQTDVIRKNHRELLDVSRQAGMAEVATSVLHNVGNVLTSVTVSSTLIGEKIKSSKAESLTKVVNLLRQHEGDLGEFLTSDAKGKRLVEFLQQLAGHLVNEQEDLHHEANHLQKNIEHIREIVSMQQKYAKIVAVEEPLKIADLVEDALSMNAAALERHQVQVLREYGTDLPEIVIDKNKILQILINLIQNAKYACSELRAAEKKLSIKVVQEGQRVKILVIDNGVGIPSENLNRIFNHGFTTRKEGHGFGLHSGALAAGELGGKLSVQSEGVGRGAVFTLELPLIRKN